MKNRLILFSSVMYSALLSTIDTSSAMRTIINNANLIIKTERDETIINNRHCKITTGKINASITNKNAEAILEILGENAHAEIINNESGTVEQSTGTVNEVTNNDIYNQTGGTVNQVTNTGEYNINNTNIIDKIINNNDNAVFNIKGEETCIPQITNEAGTVNHIEGAVTNVNNCAKDDDPQPAYNQSGGTIEEIKNDGDYIYKGGAVNKFTQAGSKASFAVVDNAEFELKGDNVIANGAIVLGTSGEGATKGALTINNGAENKAKIITNANSTLTVNEGSALTALVGTNVMTGSTIETYGTTRFEGIDNDTENVVTLAGTVEVSDGGTANIISVNEADGLGEDDKTHATLIQTGGTSNINAFVTLGENTNVTGGTVNAKGDIELHGNMTTGDNNATFNLTGHDSILHIKGGTTELNGGNNLDKVNWEGNVFLDGGKLILKNIVDDSAINTTKVNKTGYLTAQSGELFIQGDTVLLNGGDIIRDSVDLTIEGNVEVQENGTMYVSGDDDINGKMSVNGGNLHLEDITTDENKYVEANAGILKVREGSTLTLNNDNDQISYNVDLNLAGNLIIDNNNKTGVTLNNIGTDSGDNWDASIELKKGILTLENVLKSTNNVSKYNQSGGELRLFQTSLTLNAGAKLNGGTINFGLTPQEDDPNEGGGGGTITFDDGGNGLLHSSPVMLHAPIRRIKDIEAKKLKAENTGMLRADPNPIRLRADQNSSDVTISNGEDNNAKVFAIPNNLEFTTESTINICGTKAETGKPTTFTFNEGSHMDVGTISVGDDNGNGNIVYTADNVIINKDVAIAIKNNTEFNVDGATTRITFNTDNPKAQFDGTINQSDGTVAILGTGEKNGTLKSTGGVLEIGNGITETSVTLNNSDDKISGNCYVQVAPNTTFDFSENKVETVVGNKGTINVTDGNISAPIKSESGVDELTGTTNIYGNTINVATISQETINIKDEAQFSTTADIKTKTLNFGTNSSIDIKNSSIISNTMTNVNTNEYKLDNANLFLKEQSSDINGEIITSGDKVILYINDMKFNDCVNVTPGCNTYLVSGQIGAVTIPWGARLTAASSGSAATKDDVANAGADTNKSGKLIVEKDDQVDGDLVLNDAEIEIQNKTIVFHEKPTLEAYLSGQHSPSAEVPGPYFQRTGNGKLILNNSNITIPSIDLLQTMENIVFIGSSSLNVGAGTINNFKFTNTFNTLDDEYGNYEIKDSATFGSDTSNKVDFNIDMYARSNEDKKYDSFGSGTAKLIAGNGTDAVINISNWTLHDTIFGNDAPIDEHISMQIFKFGSIQEGHKFTFTASDKEVLTPIGYYKLNSKGDGLYSFDLTRYNPGVFRGQIVTTAQLQNQLTINNTVFDHIMSNDNNCDCYPENKNVTKNRYVWAKLYGGKEELHLNQNFDVNSKAYGLIFGFDFNPVLKNDLTLIPSIFMAYNHAKQKYNDNYSSHQEGGQFGFSSMLSSGQMKFGAIVYGGYYTNKMAMPDNITDKANNWFGGASFRGVYDICVSQNVTIQPNISVNCNSFGATDWKTDFGSMGMKLNTLEGISITPGVNVILQTSMLNLSCSVQYVPELKLKKGHMQYSVGIQGNFSKNFSGNLLATMNSLGKSGFGVQAGISYKF